MAGKAKIQRIRQGDFRIECPCCKRKHRLEQIAATGFLLDGDENDTFELLDSGDYAMIHPGFVCRNLRCQFMGSAIFAPHAV